MKKFLFITLTLIMFSSNAFAANVQYNIRVDGIVCPFCVKTSANALAKIDGVNEVSTDLEKGLIKVCADEKVNFTDEQLTDLFLKNGFTYKGMEKKDICELQ